MIMEDKRLFVGNLPPGVTEEELKTEFNAYGNVKNVELKYKENLVDNTNPTFFAFITIAADDYQIETCIQEFRQEQYRGRYLTVSVARESFLDRLKREREEANSKLKVLPQQTSVVIPEKETVTASASAIDDINSKLIFKSKTVAAAVNDDDDTSSDSESSSESSSDESNEEIKKEALPPAQSESLITKKQASHSIQNGKIKIERGINVEPIHVIHKNEKVLNNLLNDKEKTADMKRKESMMKMRNQYTNQKLAIQKALAAVDNKLPQKTQFDDYDEEEIETKTQTKKINLFNNDDDPEEEDDENMTEDFAIKEQFEGVQGQKLMKLQSKFASDKRFEMNKQFLDNTNDPPAIDIKDNDATDTTDERKWQLGIIEEVIGHKLSSLSAINRKKLRKTMERYDPTKQEHEKFVKNIEKVAKTIKISKINDQLVENDDDGQQVSKEQFYKINDNLKNSLKRSKNDSFSLLAMFGRNKEDKNIQEKTNDNNYNAKTLNNLYEKSNNPFKYDSSESEDEAVTANEVKPSNHPQSIDKAKKTDQKNQIWNENFFIFSKDQRLIDGAEFFQAVKSNNVNEEDFEKIQLKIKKIINKKIQKTKKNLKTNSRSDKKVTNKYFRGGRR